MKSKIDVLVFPTFAENPFTGMIYSEAAHKGIVPVYVDSLNDFLQHVAALEAGSVVHLQWTQPIIQGAGGLRSAIFASIRFKRSIRLARRREIALVWTIHNKLPHEMAFPRLEISLNRFLAKNAKKIHVLNRETAAVVSDIYSLDDRKVVYIPHPHYGNEYPNTCTDAGARKKLGITSRQKVILFLGNIRPYKGVERLVDAYREMQKNDPDLVLLLAGRIHHSIENFLSTAQAEFPNLRIERGPIPDEEIQVFMRAADVCVFPFTSVLNSGSIVLAASFRKPVVTTAHRALQNEYSADRWISFFDDENASHLAASISAALEQALENKDFEEFFIRSNPNEVSSQFLDVLSSVAMRELQ